MEKELGTYSKVALNYTDSSHHHSHGPSQQIIYYTALRKEILRFGLTRQAEDEMECYAMG